MKDGKGNWMNRLRSVLDLLTHKRTVKSARITYQVVWNLILILIIVVFLGATFAGGVGAGYFASLVKDEPIRSYESMSKDIYNYEETSDLFFANNVYLGKLRTDLDREEVKLDEVSKHLIDAVIATEDEYFYEHDGVVPKAILRALLQEVTNSSVQSGGSTLTQQLIKNQILTNEVSFERKAKEILLALRLEKFFDKKEILEAYLNVSTFGRNSSGRNIAGVQAAAKGIFGVTASELTLPQAAFIAGLPQSPFGYTPFNRDKTVKSAEGLQPGLNRMKTVLNRMYTGGYISKQQHDEAIAYDITKDFIPPKESTIDNYPYLTFEIEKRAVDILSKILAKKDGYEEEDLNKDEALKAEYMALADRNLRQNGYQIHSTINKDIYDRMQQVKDNFQHYGSDKPQQVKDPETKEMKTIMEPVEVGAILIENKTGKILSFVGGRDFEREELNHATSAVRPNGSTMKPILVYGPAFDLGKLSPGSVLPDVEVRLKPGDSKPWPNNYAKTYTGLTSVRNALIHSHNVPAVIAYKNILGNRPAQYLEKMGFTSLQPDDYTNLATAIGSLKYGVTVEENVNAFATFANSGKFVDAYLIEKIVDKKGNVVYQHEVKETEVFSPQASYLTIDMMRDVNRRGTATTVNSRLKFRADWAGKTGTGHDYHDVWYVGINPNVSFGTWMGHDTPKPMQSRGMSQSIRNMYIWTDLINAAYEVAPDIIAPKENFKMPGGIIKRSYCAVSGLLPSEVCSKAGLVESDLYIAKYVPTKVDDSLVSGKFVRIGDKNYLAMDSTPTEFTEDGVILNPEYMESIIGHKIRDPYQLIPKRDAWSNLLVADDKLEENGRKPGAISLRNAGQVLSWNQHPDADIVGYRVYNGDRKVASIKVGAALTFKAGTGQFTVTAVDIAGNESPRSNIIELGIIPPPEEPTDPEPEDPEKPGKPGKPEKPGDPEDPEDQ